MITSLLMQVDGLPNHTVIVAAANHPELLDRAVWRRIQLRLLLDPPSTDNLGDILAMIAQRKGGRWGYSPAELANQLHPIS